MRYALLLALVLAAFQESPPLTRDRAVELARQALSKKTGEPVERIALRSAAEVEWPDAGLGCGVPGQVYAQVVTPGYRVVLAVADKIYRVHTSADRALVCGTGLGVVPAPLTPAEDRAAQAGPVPEPADAASRKLVARAREDLAKRLGVPGDTLILLEYAEVTWPDRGLGCPKPGVAYPQVTVDGVRIRLGAGGRSYEYHAGGGRGPFLCEAPKR